MGMVKDYSNSFVRLTLYQGKKGSTVKQMEPFEDGTSWQATYVSPTQTCLIKAIKLFNEKAKYLEERGTRWRRIYG